MRKFNPWAYIRKFQYLIVSLALLAGIVFYMLVIPFQTYTASAIIEYTNEGASSGLAPDGTQIDTSEIYSVSVMQGVFDRMGLDYNEYNLDEFRSRVKVTEIMSEEEIAVQEAQNSQGEEAESKPTNYMISFTGSHADAQNPEEFTRQVLDNLIDVYLSEYAENHISGSNVVNTIAQLSDGNYDYLETIEIISENVTNAISQLNSYIQGDSVYRASSTGYSFGDIYREFGVIQQTDIPNIFAYILSNKVSKDTDVLISKYEKRISDYDISNSANDAEAEAINNIISTYVNMMRESGNTNITAEYILDNVHDSYYQDENENWVKPDETVQYDVLLEDYVASQTDIENAKIEIAYCNYIIGVFSGKTQVGDGLVVETDEALVDTGTEENVPDGNSENQSGEADFVSDVEIDAEEEVQSVQTETAVETGNEQAEVTADIAEVSQLEAASVTESMLENVIAKLNNLYVILDATSKEYNEYAGAANIGLISSIGMETGMQLVLYTCIVVAVAAVLLAIGIIVLGRIMDIFTYHVYVDHKFSLPNRKACDRYMAGYAGRMLPENMTCISIVVPDMKKKNGEYGVEACDTMIKKLISIMQSVYSEIEDHFIGVNGLGQFLIFLKDTSYDQCMAYMQYVEAQVQNYNKTLAAGECPVSYKYGAVESHRDSLYNIRALLLKAITKCSASPVYDGNGHKEEKEEEVSRTDRDKRLDNLLVRMEEMRRHG